MQISWKSRIFFDLQGTQRGKINDELDIDLRGSGFDQPASSWTETNWNELIIALENKQNSNQNYARTHPSDILPEKARVVSAADHAAVEAAKCYEAQILGNANSLAPQSLPTSPTPSQVDTEPTVLELTDQQRQQQFNKIADATSDDVLKGLDSSKASKPQEKPVTPAKPPKTYREATSCLRLVNGGHGFFQNQLRNSCNFAVLYSFCTLSAKGTGAFSCKANKFGSDSIKPGGTGGGMGLGVPEADDPFEMHWIGCEYPGIPSNLRFDGTKIKADKCL